MFNRNGVGRVAGWGLVCGGGAGIVGQGPAADFGIEGGILDLERTFDIRDEMFEVFVEDVGEKTILRRFLAIGFFREGVDDQWILPGMFTFPQRSLCVPSFLISPPGGNKCLSLFGKRVEEPRLRSLDLCDRELRQPYSFSSPF